MSRRQRPARRRTGAGVAAMVLAFAGCSLSPPSASDRVRAAIDEAPAPDQFTFRHEAAGTRVLDCVLPFRRFEGVVDVGARVVELRADGGTIAFVRPGEVLLDADVLGDAASGTGWVRLTGVDASSRDALRSVVGAELAGYLVAVPPPSGRDTVLSALDDGAEVEIVRNDTAGLRVRLTVASDPRDIAVVAHIEPEGSVDEVTVTPAGADGAEVGASGWTVTYASTAEDVRLPAVEAEEVRIDALRGLAQADARTCEVPL